MPSSLALVLQTFPSEKVPVAVAIWGAIGAVAGASGPTLGALVVENFGWRWAFFINLPVGIVSFALGRRVLPEGREANPGRLPDPLGVVLLAAGLALLAFAIVKTDEWGWLSTAFVGTVAVSAVLIAVFFWRCSRVSNPLLDLSLFDSQSFRWANPAMLIYASGFSAMFLGNVLFLTEVWHYSILRAGMAISVGPLIVAVTAPFFGRLAGRVGQRALVVPGGLVWASGGVLLLSRATTDADYVGDYLPALVLTALGVSLVLPQLSSAAVQGLPRRSVRLGLGGEPGGAQPGATLGVALVVAFTADVDSRDGALVLPPGVVVARRVRTRRDAAGDPASSPHHCRQARCARRAGRGMSALDAHHDVRSHDRGHDR